jgi:hypothetical protein
MKHLSNSKLFFVALIGLSIMQACNKDNNGPQVPDKVKKLMYNWHITDITVPRESGADSSISKTCTSDDLAKFTQAGFDFDDGAAKCDSTLFFYSKGNWTYKLTDDSIQLVATTPAKYLSWKVLLLNDSIMKVRYTDSLNPAKKLVKTISFKH